MRMKHLVAGAVPISRIALLAALVLMGTVVLPVGVAMVPVASASPSDSGLTAEQVADEILRVQARADLTAQRWAEAASLSEDLAAQILAVGGRVAEMSSKYDALNSQMTEIAVNRFTGAAGGTLLFFMGDPNSNMQVEALSRMALDGGAANLDTVDAARSDLHAEQANLKALNDQNAQLVDDLAARQTELDAQLIELATLRDQLKVQEVKRAYDAKVAQQRREEAAAAAAKAARAAAEQQAHPPPPARGGGAQSPPVTNQPPAKAPPPIVASGSWPCPVAGPNAFGDTWGAPRSGGRKHEGVDMMSPLGTPVVAVVDGNAVMKTATLGGNVIWLAGVDGNSYFYGHLSAWEGTSRTVSAGEVIGYVGATGNTTANHLHFGIYPGGGAAVNPYPIVRQHC